MGFQDGYGPGAFGFSDPALVIRSAWNLPLLLVVLPMSKYRPPWHASFVMKTKTGYFAMSTCKYATFYYNDY